MERRRRRRRAAGAGFCCCCCGFSILVLLGLISLVVVIPVVYVRTQTTTLTTTESTEIITTAPALILEISLMLSEQLHLGENEMLNPGDRIFYTVVVLNTGTAPLVNATIDSSYPLLACNLPEMLLPGQNYTCMGVRTINLDNILQGSVNLTVTVGTETETIMTDLTRVTVPDLTVNVCGMPNFEDDTVELMIKIFNSGSATLLNVTYNGEIVFEELLPMQMEILTRIFNQTTTNFTTIVTAIDITSEQILERVVETTVDLTEPVVAALFLSDRVGEAPLDTITSSDAPVSLSLFGFTEFPHCLSALAYFEHEINVTNSGTDIIYNVTVDTWLEDARAELSALIGPNQYWVWTIDCSPMFMTNVIPVMFPGETQTCRVFYHIGSDGIYTKKRVLNTNNEWIATLNYYARDWGLNMTRITNASVIGTSHTNHSIVTASSADTEVYFEGATLVPVGLDSDPYLSYRSEESTNIILSHSPQPIEWPLGFVPLLINGPTAVDLFNRPDLCSGYQDGNIFERDGPGAWSLNMTFSDVDVRHQIAYLQFSYNMRVFSTTPFAFSAYQIQIETFPSHLRDTWTVESTVTFGNMATAIQWNSISGIISNLPVTVSDGSAIKTFGFRIGDLRQYAAIRFYGAEIPLFPFVGANRPRYDFQYNIFEAVTLTPATDDSRDRGVNYTFLL